MSDPSVMASDPGHTAWVAANAGAGKTYTLANRVARLLLAGTRPERILCLTFTKAAAAEMQDRLFVQLGEWAMLDDAPLRARIEAIGGAGELEDKSSLAKARRLFAQALETPGGLKVLTIHAFCQSVLARFPLEAGVAPAFEVLDEQSARALINETRFAVLDRAGGGDARLAAAVAHLVTETSETRLGQILDAALTADRNRVDRFFVALGKNNLADAVRRAHGVAEEETPARIARDFCSRLSREAETLRDIRDWLSSGSTNDVKLSAALVSFLAADFSESAFLLLGEVVLTDKGEPLKRLVTKKLVETRDDLATYLQDLQQSFCASLARFQAARAADLAEAALTLIGALRAEYKSAKHARGVLDYDDLIAETRALLEKRGAAAWVLYKLDGGIDHVLVDEAQDTSPEQWAILRKLTEEFFAGEGKASATGTNAEKKHLRTLFVVGDEKQSIFSFQGAEPALFDINRRHFKALAEGAGLVFRDQPLITSRRSAPEILRFVDAVFENEAAREGLTSGHAPITHRAFRETAPGGIILWPPLRPACPPEFDAWRPVDVPGPDSPVVRLAARIADHIRQWLDRGATLPGHERPIAPGDIMILLPRREPFGSEVIRELKVRGVPVAGADRVVLTEQIAAMDLMALGRFAIQRDDDLTLAALLRSPLCGLDEDALYHLAQGRDGDLWSALVASAAVDPALARVRNYLAEMLARADYAPPFEFYAHALSARGGRQMLLARLGAESADAIDEFLSLALSYEKNGTPSLEGFLDWLARGATQIKRDMDRGRNEVRVMTVHGAKGLEADIVILPDTTTLREPAAREGRLLYSQDGVLFPLATKHAPARVRAAQEALKAEWGREHRRLLYVALTRARDRLIICGFENRHGTKNGSWYKLAEAAAQKLGVPLAGEEGLGIGVLAETARPRPQQLVKEESLPGWARRPAPTEPERPRLIRPSDVADAVTSPREIHRFRRGLVVHALLARLPELDHPRRDTVARAFARARGFSPEEAEALSAEILAVFTDPAFAAAFGPNSRAETGLVADLPELGPGARINGRIDRLWMSEEEVLILDFKTNRPPPADERAVNRASLNQMALYRAGAARVFPGRRIVCGLLFTDGPRLFRLSDALLDATWADLRARLDPGEVHS